MLAVRADLADRLNEIATFRGTTLYALVNDALDSVITLEQVGLTHRGVLEEQKVLQAARISGFLPCPESLWYEIVEQAHRDGGDWMAEKWFEAGARCAKLYIVREGGEDFLAAFKRDILNLTWNASDFSFTESYGEVLVRCISRKFSEPYAGLFSRYLEGAFAAFGYQCVQRDVAKGAFQLRLSKKEYAIPSESSEPTLAYKNPKASAALAGQP